MKQAEPNPLQRELARGQVAGPHPDADLLTGFAEGSLLERERAEVFAHLASCAECRELLHVAMGAVEDQVSEEELVAAAAPVAAARPFLLARPTHARPRTWLPWASVAAAILLLCTVGLVYRQRLDMKQQAGAQNTAAVSIPVQPLPPAPAEPSAKLGATAAKPTAERLKSAEPVTEASPMASAAETPAAEPKQEELEQQESTQSGARYKVAPVEAAAARASQKEPFITAQARTQAQVQAHAEFHEQVQKQVAAQPSPGFFAQQPARILNNSSLAALQARPNWRIDSTGAAQRSFGNGVWQRVLPEETATMRVVSVFDGVVWVGGDSTRLHRSADGGDTWTLMPLPPKGGRDHAIVHIVFQTEQMGVVKAEDGTSWSTTDGGVSWK